MRLALLLGSLLLADAAALASITVSSSSRSAVVSAHNRVQLQIPRPARPSPPVLGSQAQQRDDRDDLVLLSASGMRFDHAPDSWIDLDDEPEVPSFDEPSIDYMIR